MGLAVSALATPKRAGCLTTTVAGVRRGTGQACGTRRGWFHARAPTVETHVFVHRSLDSRLAFRVAGGPLLEPSMRICLRASGAYADSRERSPNSQDLNAQKPLLLWSDLIAPTKSEKCVVRLEPNKDVRVMGHAMDCQELLPLVSSHENAGPTDLSVSFALVSIRMAVLRTLGKGQKHPGRISTFDNLRSIVWTWRCSPRNATGRFPNRRTATLTAA